MNTTRVTFVMANSGHASEAPQRVHWLALTQTYPALERRIAPAGPRDKREASLTTMSTAYTGETAPPAAAQARGLTKVYGEGETLVTALREISVAFERGRFSAIMGPSGSGKSTLMHCLAGLDSITSGTALIGDVEINTLSDKALTLLRREAVGFIFQAFNLIPTLTALENITLPMDIAGRKPDQAWLDTVIDAVQLRDRLHHKPTELSGGQQQRVACARALASRPTIIFADEPTGNLDSRSGAEVLGMLRRAVRDMGQTIVMVTHDPAAASYADRVVFLSDGAVIDELLNPTQPAVLERMAQLEAARAEIGER
jgi:putative ABC transport system ATP-binding protein